MTEKFGINLGENLEEILRGETPPDKEPQSPRESEPIAGKTREEKIAAFRARREELKKKVEELERKGGKKFDEAYQSAGAEAYDRGTAEHYNFDIKKIDEAVEEAKKVGNPRYRKLSVERLEAAKALIEKEIGIEPPPSPGPASSVVKEPEPLVEKTGEDIIGDMSKEGMPFTAPFPEDIKEELEKKQKKDEFPPTAPLPKDIKEEARREEYVQTAPLPEDIAKQAQEEAKQEQQPTAPKGTAQESQEMKTEIDNVLRGDILEDHAKNLEARKTAAELIEARKAMPEVWAYQKEKRLLEAAGAGGIDPARAARMENAGKAYEDALTRLNSLFCGEKETIFRNRGKSEEEIKQGLFDTKWNFYAAEDYRLAALRHEALPFEMKSLAAINARFNQPFEWIIESKVGKFFHLKKEHAKYLRVGFGAAVATGIGLGTGAVAGAGFAALFAGTRIGVGIGLMTAGGFLGGGAKRYTEKLFSAQTEENISNLLKKNRAEFARLRKEQATADALEKSFQQEREKHQKGIARELRKKGIKGAAVSTGIVLGSFLIARTAYAGVSDVLGPETIPGAGGGRGGDMPPETSPIKPHMAITEDSIRDRIGDAWERFTQGAKKIMWEDPKKFWGEAGEHVYERAKELEVPGRLHAEALARALEEAAADMQARGKLGIPGLWEVERPKGLGGAPLPPEGAPMGPEIPKSEVGVMPPEASTLVTPKLGPSIYPEESTLVKPKLGPSIYPEAPKAPTPEDIERLSYVAKEAGKAAEKIMVVSKGGSVWETAMDMKRQGIMTTEQFNEAWEKSTVVINGKEVPLRDAWLVHGKDALRFVERPQGPRLELIDAKDAFKVGTYKELGDAYDALGKEKPQALREALAQEQHLPNAAKRLEELANTKIARPAANPNIFEGIKNAPTAEGGSLVGVLENSKSYIETFEKASLADQEITIQRWEHTLQDLRNLKGQPNIDQAFLNDLTKTENLFSQLQKNEAYLGNLKAWGEVGKFWSPKLGLDANEWRAFTERWTVEKFLRAAEQIKDHEFKPANAIERALRGRIGAVSDLEGHIAAKLGIKMEDLQDIKKIPRGLATKPLGRILKNTL